MDDDSFDPRSWGRSKPPSARPAEPAEPAAAPGPAASLPPAWREVGQAKAAIAPPPKADRRMADRPWVAWLASGLVLAAGLATAWTTRQAPLVPESPTAEPTEAVPGIVQRTLNLASAADIAGALQAAGVPAAEAQAAAGAVGAVLNRPGEVRAVIELVPAGQGMTLQRLQASYGDGTGAVVNRAADGSFKGSAVAAELTKQIKVLRGELDTESFYSSAVAAGLLDTLIPEFINAFTYDFNIASEVSPGDTFEVAFEQSVNAQGNPVGQPQLLYASLTTPTKSRALYRYQPAGEEVGWFDGNGASTKRGLMRTPVDGARITSQFGMRFHPVLHYNKMHKGTDFAAPIGTPIFAAADGVVEWAAMKGPNGNLTILKHDKGMETYYLHQNMFMPGVTAGAQVHQGQKIGEIGTTGRSTGPHLHYEVHMEGEPVDPLSIQTDDSQRKTLAGAALQGFIAQRDRVDVARANQAR